MNFPDDLVPGMILLYDGSNVFDTVENLVSGDDKAHIEVVAGHNQTAASRNLIGVKELFTFNPVGLVQVRMPIKTFNLEAALKWYQTIAGSPYGFDDLFITVTSNDGSTNIQPMPTKPTPMDCSCFANWFLLAGMCPQFNDVFDARKIRPRDYELSRESVILWNKPLST